MARFALILAEFESSGTLFSAQNTGGLDTYTYYMHAEWGGMAELNIFNLKMKH